MKHEFTDKQITTAANKSLFHYGEYNSERGYSWSMTAESLRSFLNALPEPQDDWEECTFEDIQKGDRVRMVQAARTTDFHLPVIETHPTHLVLQDNTQCSNFHKAVYYRIPAPVQPPDPDNNPVILVREVHGKTYDPPVVAIVRDSSTQNHPVYVYGDNGSAFPDYITDWSPAKVVADDE